MLLLAMLWQEVDPVAETLSDYRMLTRAESPCTERSREEIVVCARHDADHYRAPLATPPRSRDAEPRTTALLDPHAPACGQGAFTVGCGKIGVSASVAFGHGAGSGAVAVTTERRPER